MKGLNDLTIDNVKLNGKKLDARIEQAIEGEPILERSIDRASTITMDVADGDQELITSQLFDQRLLLRFDDLQFVLQSVNKSGPTLSLAFEDAAISDLRQVRGPRKAAKKTSSRTKFAREIVREVKWLNFRGDPGDKNLVALVQKKKEKGWSALKRLADERQWRCFVAEEVVYFGSDDWLLSLGKPFRIRPSDEGVIDIDFEYNGGKRANTATITCMADRWAARPGAPVDIDGMGPLVGKRLWLVQSISRPLNSRLTTVQLVRKTPELPEPKPDKRPNGFLDGLPARFASGEKSGRALVEVLMTQKGDDYVFGAEVSLNDPNPERFDCSEFIQWGMAQLGFGGFPDGSSNQYAHCQKISTGKAIKIPGALLWRPGHIACSRGDGKTIEARGSAYGVNVFDAREGRDFHQGLLIPELTYFAKAQAGGRGGETEEQVKTLIRQIFGRHAPEAIRVFTCESGLDPKERNKNSNGSVDRGVAQINSVHRGTLYAAKDEGRLFEAEFNLRVAKRLHARDGWGPWVCAHKLGIV